MHAMYCDIVTVPMYPILHYRRIRTYKPYLDAIVDIIQGGSSYSLFQGIVNTAQENTTNQTADVLAEDQLQPPWTW